MTLRHSIVSRYFVGAVLVLLVLFVSPHLLFASSLTSMSDTLSTQKASTVANHRVAFTSPSGVSSGTITVDFSNAVSSTGSVDFTDIDLSYGTLGTETEATLATSAAAATWGASLSSSILTLTYPTSGGTAIASGDKVVIEVGTNASGGVNQMTNTTAGSSKVLTITTASDSGKLAIAIVDASSVTVTNNIDVPSAPSSLSEATGASSVTLTWTDNSSNETLFLIERSITGGSFSQIGSVATGSTTYTDSTVRGNTRYSYRVRATNGVDNSTYSDTVNVTLLGGTTASLSAPTTTTSTTTPTTTPDGSTSTSDSTSTNNTQSTTDTNTASGATSQTTDTIIRPRPSDEVPFDATPSAPGVGGSGSTTSSGSTTTGGESTGGSTTSGGGTTGSSVVGGESTGGSTTSGGGSLSGGAIGGGGGGIVTGGISTGGVVGGSGSGSGEVGMAAGYSADLFTTAGISQTNTFITNPLVWNVMMTSGGSTPYSSGTFCTKTTTNFVPCIPTDAFPGPVYQTSINMAGALYPLSFDEDKQCYTGTVAVPSGLGSYVMSLRTTYEDGTTSVVDSKLAVQNSCADFVLAAMEPNPFVIPGLPEEVQQKVSVQIQSFNNQTENIVEKGETTLQVASVVVATSILVLAPSMVGNLPNAYHFVYQNITSIFSLFGYKKKRRKKWGVVYGAFSKEPESLAIVRLYNAVTKKLLETQVTDKTGRFSFITQAGKYIVKVSKAPFVFPSNIIKGNADGSYGNIYRGGEIYLASDSDEISISIPIDPKQRTSIKEGSFFGAVLDLLEKYGPYFALVSFLVSVSLIIYAPSPLNITIFILNVLVVLLQFLVVPRIRKSWGIVFDDSTNKPLSLATISLFDAKSNKLVRSRLSDVHGRFNFLVPAGDYKIIASRSNYDFPSKPNKKASTYRHLYFGEKLHIKKNNGVIRVNIPMHRRPLA
ncbi:MAG: hypothetical protein Q8P11_03335 [bacterium]|nr:hypothetical protein [bacterium]